MLSPKPTQTITLKVRSARLAEVYRDTIRIAEADRGPLRTGRIHQIKVGKRTTYAVLRGLAGTSAGQIRMDEATRDRLGLTFGQDHAFKIRQVGFWGSLCWGWTATDPAIAVAARLGVLSLGLGTLSLVLAAWPLLESIGH